MSDSEVVVEIARRTLGDHFGIDASDVPVESVKSFVEHYFAGGWEKFAADNAPAQPRTNTGQLALKRQLREALDGEIKVRFGDLDEIVSVKVEDDMVQALIRVYEVTEQKIRWKVTRSGLRLMAWRRVAFDYYGTTMHRWKSLDSITVWDDSPKFDAVASQYSKIKTPDEYRDALAWEEMCWRPGTGRTPMDGEKVRTAAFNQFFRSFGLGEE